ncbi:MAG: DUF2281 domain-containing protein [Bacteroidota bacterium]
MKKYLNPSKKSKKRFIGSMKGSLVSMSEDFNEPLDDFKNYMPDDDFIKKLEEKISRD